MVKIVGGDGEVMQCAALAAHCASEDCPSQFGGDVTAMQQQVESWGCCTEDSGGGSPSQGPYLSQSR